MKHLPFDSIYRPDFEVVEQREGNLTYYPHTDQLPVLLRALNLEFSGALPPRIEAANAQTPDYRKIIRCSAVNMFCRFINGSRPDHLRLFALVDRDIVSRVAIAQRITEVTRRGLCHRFRFYAGDDFSTEIYLSGRQVVFSDHVLQRFSERVPANVGEDLSTLLYCFFTSEIIALTVNNTRAFIVSWRHSILAFTYKESDTKYLITTCLTVNEINSLEMETPPQAFNFHYDPAFTKPKLRHWLPFYEMQNRFKCWENKTPFWRPKANAKAAGWHLVAACIKESMIKEGCGPGSHIYFLDHVPGPCLVGLQPGEKECQIDELAVLKETHPNYDWEKDIAERDAEARRLTPRIDN